MPDLRLLAAEPTDAERTAIDAVVGVADPTDGRVTRSGLNPLLRQ